VSRSRRSRALLALAVALLLLGGAIGGARILSERSALVIPCTSGVVGCLAFSPDGNLLAAGDRSGWVHVWSLVGGEAREKRIKLSDSQLEEVAVSDGGAVACGTHEGAVELFPHALVSDARVNLFDEETAPVGNKPFAFSPSGKHLVVARTRLVLFETERGTFCDGDWIGPDFATATLPGAAIAFASETNVVVACEGGVWTWKPGAPPVQVAANVGDGIFTLSPRGTLWTTTPRWVYGSFLPLNVHSVAEGRIVASLPSKSFADPVFSPDDELVARAHWPLEVVDVRSGAAVARFEKPREAPRDGIAAIAFSPASDRIAVAGGNSIRVLPFRR
jgi:WD40 repeat protein